MRILRRRIIHIATTMEVYFKVFRLSLILNGHEASDRRVT